MLVLSFKNKYPIIVTTVPTPAFTRPMIESIMYFVCLSVCFFACPYVGKKY